MTTSIQAELRTCASCEWIFKMNETCRSCPKCGFAHYGARQVYGNKAYGYSKTQKPWVDRKAADYALKLLDEVRKTQ